MYLEISLPRELSGLEIISIFREGNFSSELKKIGWKKKIRIVSTEVIPGCLMETPHTLQIYLKKDSKLGREKTITFLIDTDETYTQLLPFYDENLTLKEIEIVKTMIKNYILNAAEKEITPMKKFFYSSNKKSSKAFPKLLQYIKNS